MPEITPFQGVRPDPALADRIAALPYDVYNRKESLCGSSTGSLFPF